MRVITAPREYKVQDTDVSVFLAGGITGCSEWQSNLIESLANMGDELVLLNPRRPDFPMGDPDAGKLQIAWEFRHLLVSDAVSFWFAADQVQPIVLFELGTQVKDSDTPIFVGASPGYPRRFDVVEQVEHYSSFFRKKSIQVRANLMALTFDIQEFYYQTLEGRVRGR